MIEIDATGKGLLGMPPAVFLRDYWQKQPLLIRGAFANFASPIEPEDLAGLACEDGVLARLIEHDKRDDSWRVRHGPFAEDDFPGLPDHDWTLLVQDVDKWDGDVHRTNNKHRWRRRVGFDKDLGLAGGGGVAPRATLGARQHGEHVLHDRLLGQARAQPANCLAARAGQQFRAHLARAANNCRHSDRLLGGERGGQGLVDAHICLR